LKINFTNILKSLINKTIFENIFLIILKIKTKEITAILIKRKNDNILKYNNISYNFLKVLKLSFTIYIIKIIIIC
jgi:hypothetical protein